jgi:membrane protease YdiL (CAAX protease family)
VTRRLRTLPTDPVAAIRSGLPILLAFVAALLPPVRPLVLVALAGGLAVALRRDAAVRWSWAAPIPAVALLASRQAPWAPCVALHPASDSARAVIELIVLGVAVTALAYLLGSSWRELGIRRPARDVVGQSLVAFVVAAALVPVVRVVAGEPVGEVFPAAGELGPRVVFAAALAAGVEVAWRGALLRWSARVVGVGPAVVTQAVVFGGAALPGQIGVVGAVLVALLGLAAGVAAVRTRSLLLPFAVHAGILVGIEPALRCVVGG